MVDGEDSSSKCSIKGDTIYVAGKLIVNLIHCVLNQMAYLLSTVRLKYSAQRCVIKDRSQSK